LEELHRFRIINKIEGYSYLILIFIAMPLKYMMGMGMPNKIVGMTHGVLFVLFAIFLTLAPLTKKDQLIYFILSLIPFGSFYIDKMTKESRVLVKG